MAKQTFFSDFAIQSYSWIRMHQSAYDFFIHEYNVEKYNTDRNLIYLLRQDSPMEEGIKVAYSTSDAATQIKEKYAEITDILHVNGMSGNLCKYNGTDIKQFLLSVPTLL